MYHQMECLSVKELSEDAGKHMVQWLKISEQILMSMDEIMPFKQS